MSTYQFDFWPPRDVTHFDRKKPKSQKWMMLLSMRGLSKTIETIKSTEDRMAAAAQLIRHVLWLTDHNKYPPIDLSLKSRKIFYRTMNNAAEMTTPEALYEMLSYAEFTHHVPLPPEYLHDCARAHCVVMKMTKVAVRGEGDKLVTLELSHDVVALIGRMIPRYFLWFGEK